MRKFRGTLSVNWYALPLAEHWTLQGVDSSSSSVDTGHYAPSVGYYFTGFLGFGDLLTEAYVQQANLCCASQEDSERGHLHQVHGGPGVAWFNPVFTPGQ